MTERPASATTDATASVRERIVDLVARRPGLPVAQLREQLGIGWGTIYHHLVKLGEEGALHTVVVGRRRLLFAASFEEDLHVVKARAHLRGRTAARIAQAIAEHGPVSVTVLAERLGESPRTLYYHVGHLLDHGLVTSSPRMRYFGLRAAPLLLALLPGAPSPPAPADGDAAGP